MVGVETRMAVASLRNCSKLHDTYIVPFTPSMFEPSNLARRVMEKRRRGHGGLWNILWLRDCQAGKIFHAGLGTFQCLTSRLLGHHMENFNKYFIKG